MKKPVLVIMAAGMGSRYGGLKQIDPVDPEGHIIIDFSLYDAKEAGFEKVVFIIKEENEALFKEAIGDRVAGDMEVAYAFQKLDNIPEGFEVPKERKKPWGTAHAVLSAAPFITGPLAVINADDYYGKEAFKKIYNYLTTHDDDDRYHYTMIGYHLKNTVTENGHVARGVCQMSEAGELLGIHEYTRIEKKPDGIYATEDEGQSWIPLHADTVVSMNMWGFSHSILEEIQAGFPAFMEKGLKENPLKCEYFLPGVVSDLVGENRAVVDVLTSPDKWYGVTYRDDKPMVEAAIENMKVRGLYPRKLWRSEA